MSPSPQNSALSALSEKELEILRLLTAGHTVKSIAVRLDRSEASINERLRDARRKTGVGSSRELARLIDAQKNWDRKIDLEPGPRGGNDADQPPNPGRRVSKGTIAMLLVLPLTAAVGLAAADLVKPRVLPQPAHATAQPASPLFGQWSLDVAEIPVEERPRSVTIRFAAGPGNTWSTVVEIVAPDGRVTRGESTAAADGVAVPVSGTMDFIDSVSLRHPAPDTLVMTLGKNGAPVSTRVYTVTKDRRTMTETIIWASGGIPKLETTHFTRVR